MLKCLRKNFYQKPKIKKQVCACNMFFPTVCVFMSMLQLTPYKFQIWEPLDANAKYSNVMFVYWLDEIHRIENSNSVLNFSSCILIDWCFFVFPSMQCSVHKLCGYGVSDRASGHCQGNLRNNDNQPGTHSHHCSFQGVGTRHHAYWQPEKVSRSLLFILLALFVQFYLKYKKLPFLNRLFFRRHYPINTVTFCDTDPQERKWVTVLCAITFDQTFDLTVKNTTWISFLQVEQTRRWKCKVRTSSSL